MLNIVCALWFDPKGRWNRYFLYGPQHVRRLRAMAHRYVSPPFTFVCMTDEPARIRYEVPADVMLVDLAPELVQHGHRYPKLTMFKPDVFHPNTRLLYLDLDCVLTGELGPLFSDDPEFRIWGDSAAHTPYNSSMIYFRAGARPQVYARFVADEGQQWLKRQGPLVEAKPRAIGTDQAWLAAVLGPNEQKWTRHDGVLSYKRDCMRQSLPAGARAVFFHGDVDPSLPKCQNRSPWIREFWHEEMA